MNSVSLIGRACAPPEIKYVGPSNRPLADFTLAVDDPFNKDPQTNKPRSYFFLVQVWGNKAEIAKAHISTGRRIGVTGRLTQEKFTPKGTETPVTKTRIVAETFDLLDLPRTKQDQSGEPETPNPPPAEEPDDIPF
jgi:single stranded DNA-binding protein